MGFESTTDQPRSMRRRRALVASGGHKYPFEGIQGTAVERHLGDAAIAEC